MRLIFTQQAYDSLEEMLMFYQSQGVTKEK